MHWYFAGVCVNVYPPGTHVHWEGSIIILPINKIMCSSCLKGNSIILEWYHHGLIHVIYNPLLHSMKVGSSSTANWQAVWDITTTTTTTASMCEFYCVPLLVDFFMPCKGGSIISNIGVPLMDLFLAHADFIFYSSCYTKNNMTSLILLLYPMEFKILAHVYIMHM